MPWLRSLLCSLLAIACAGGGKSRSEPPIAAEPSAGPASAAGGSDPTGEWAETFEIAMMSYADAAACEADQGRWSEEHGCLFPAESVARFGPREGDGWPTTIDIVATNAHTCTFEGTTRREGQALVAVAPSEIYVPGEGGAQGQMKPAECRVEVRLTAEGLSLEATDYEGIGRTKGSRRAYSPGGRVCLEPALACGGRLHRSGEAVKRGVAS